MLELSEVQEYRATYKPEGYACHEKHIEMKVLQDTSGKYSMRQLQNASFAIASDYLIALCPISISLKCVSLYPDRDC